MEPEKVGWQDRDILNEDGLVIAWKEDLESNQELSRMFGYDEDDEEVLRDEIMG